MRSHEFKDGSPDFDGQPYIYLSDAKALGLSTLQQSPGEATAIDIVPGPNADLEDAFTRLRYSELDDFTKDEIADWAHCRDLAQLSPLEQDSAMTALLNLAADQQDQIVKLQLGR